MAKNEKTRWKWEFQRYMDIVKIHGFAPAFADMAGKCAYISRKGKIDFYWDADQADKLSSELITQARTEKNFTKKWTKDAEAKADRWEVFTQEVAKKDLTKLSNAELNAILEDFYVLHLDLGSFAVFIRMIIHNAVSEFEAILKEKMVDAKDIPNALTVLTSTTKESFNGEEEQAFFKLALDILKEEDPKNLSEKALKKIEKHLEKYCWIPCGYYDEKAHTIEYYLHRLRRVAKDTEGAQQALEKLITLGTRLEEEQDRLLKRIPLTQEELKLLECLQECVYYKDFVRGALNKGYYQLYPYFTELGKRLGMSMLEVKFLFQEELKDALLKGTTHGAAVKKRMTYHVLTNQNGELVTLYGKEAEALANELEASQKTKAKELKGMPANAGYAKARARIVHDPKEIQNETHDFILVASMTTPEFVVAMQKCLAIVTDEGGITCHAAIVAREMNKPCVIGTKTATKTFKHGDILEVDADKGVVRKVGEVNRK